MSYIKQNIEQLEEDILQNAENYTDFCIKMNKEFPWHNYPLSEIWENFTTKHKYD